MKTALYCRVALADQVAIGLQERSLSCYAAGNGYTDCVVYRDNGASGLTLNRPGMNRLLADTHSGKIQNIIATDLARIARNPTLTMELLDIAERQGVKVVTVQDGELNALFDSQMKAIFQHSSTV